MERDFCLDWQAYITEAKKRRKQQKITQEKLALMCGISKPTVNAFEQGKQGISLENAFKILNMLGLLK